MCFFSSEELRVHILSHSPPISIPTQETLKNTVQGNIFPLRLIFQRRLRGLFICWCTLFFKFWFIPWWWWCVALWKDKRFQPQHLLILLHLVKGDDTTKHSFAPVWCREHCVASRMVEVATLSAFLMASHNTLKTVGLQESFCDILEKQWGKYEED